MKFGAPVWPFRCDEPYDQAIKRISSLGFRAVELIAWTREVLDTYYIPATIRELRSVIDGEGLVLSQFVLFPPKIATGRPFNLPVPPITDRPHVQMFTAEVPPGLDWDQNWLDYVAAIKEGATYAEQAGVRYSLEPHPFRYGANADGLLRLLDAVGSPALGVNLDPSHTFPVGELPHVTIYRLNKHVMHCDFLDNDGTTNVHWRPGKGKIDWERALRALKEVGYNGVISLEFEDVPGVSRGAQDVPGVYKGNTDATRELDREYVLALEYLTDLAEGVGMEVE